jgi:signal transduction histidine kinase
MNLFKALYAAGHKSFDLPIERLIALLRVALTFFCLTALITASGPQSEYTAPFELILAVYAVFGLGVTLLPTIGRLRTGWQLPAHLIDIGVISILMFFLQTLSVSFSILYVFILLSATIRWNWRGALWTTIALFALQVLMFLAIGAAVQFFINCAFLFMIGGMFAFFGISREQSAERLTQIAAWPTTRMRWHTNIGDHWLDASLAHIATVLLVPRVLIVWEISQEPYMFFSLFVDGKCQQDRTADDILGNLVSVALDGVTFAADAVRSKECLTFEGTKYVDSIVDESFQARFKISGVCSAPFSGDNCKGRLFMLDRSDWTQLDLTLAEVVASRLSIELEYYALCVRLEETAASRERIRLARDLHDGILQSLAAAALQLKMIAGHSEEKIRDEIENVRRLVLGEQRRIRAFVDGRQPLPQQQPINLHDAMQREIKAIERQWGCRIVLQSVTPQDATVPNELIRQIEFLLAEAVANAIQHGNASRINIAIERTPNHVQLRIADNGLGLVGTIGTYGQAELAVLGIGPESISKRITELHGTLSLCSSRNGVELWIGLACDDQVANKTKYKTHASG